MKQLEYKSILGNCDASPLFIVLFVRLRLLCQMAKNKQMKTTEIPLPPFIWRNFRGMNEDVLKCRFEAIVANPGIFFLSYSLELLATTAPQITKADRAFGRNEDEGAFLQKA